MTPVYDLIPSQTFGLLEYINKSRVLHDLEVVFSEKVQPLSAHTDVHLYIHNGSTQDVRAPCMLTAPADAVFRSTVCTQSI